MGCWLRGLDAKNPFIFNHFQHGLDAIPLKKAEKINQGSYAHGLVLQQRKYFQDLRIHFNSK